MALSTAKLWVKVTANVGTNNYTLKYDKGTDPWTVTLDSTDWETTDTYTGGTTSVGSTGWKSFTFTTTDIDNVTIYTRIQGAGEGNQDTLNMTFASQNNATAGDRPYIELVWASASTLRLLASTGVGI